MIMFQKMIRQLFSGECQLNSLRIDIADIDAYLYECLKLRDELSSSSTINQYQYPCKTLRNLRIYLKKVYFLEHLIEHVPSLEKLCVYFQDSLNIYPRSKAEIETLIQLNGLWFNKVR